MYDYNEAVRTDTLNCIADNYTFPVLVELLHCGYDAAYNELNQMIENSDAFGFYSGSYTCNCEEAKKNVLCNMPLLDDLVVTDDYAFIGEAFSRENWEDIDAYIRYHLHFGVLYDVVDALIEALDILCERLSQDNELSFSLLDSVA